MFSCQEKAQRKQVSFDAGDNPGTKADAGGNTGGLRQKKSAQ
jgi:hypothetical protein